MNLWSNVGTYTVGDAKDPSFIDVSPGLAYSIAVINSTAGDLVGSVTIHTAPPSDADPCVPGAWAPLDVEPYCGDPNGVVTPATVTWAVGTELLAKTQCQISAPCPDRFVKAVVTGLVGATVIGVVTRLKNQNMGAMAGINRAA